MADTLTRALRRVRTPVKDIPKRSYKATRFLLHEPVAQLERARIKRDYRLKYGPALVYDVAEQDEMFLFMKEFWAWPHHVAPMRTVSDAMRTYLVSGEVMLRDLESALRDHGRSLGELDSFLEFASGYGRFTRFLVTQIDAKKVTVSDISHPAVDFARATYGVNGFYSAESASDVNAEQQFEVIFVASLFSHLTIEHWNAWLIKLTDLLKPGGLLIFSTHGPYARDEIYDEHARARLESHAPGFDFLHTNETHGRLAEDYYGSAFVTQDYVQGVVTEHSLGTIKHVYVAKLWGSQDLYVLEKPSAAEAGVSPPAAAAEKPARAV